MSAMALPPAVGELVRQRDAALVVGAWRWLQDLHGQANSRGDHQVQRFAEFCMELVDAAAAGPCDDDDDQDQGDDV